MEKYRLVQEQKVDEAASTPLLGATLPTTAHPSRPHAPEATTPATSTVTTTTSSSSSEFPEVRITQQGKPRNYISYAMGLLVR